MARGLSEDAHHPLAPCFVLCTVFTLVGLEKVGHSPTLYFSLCVFSPLKVLERNQQIHVDIQRQVLQKLLAFRHSEY